MRNAITFQLGSHNLSRFSFVIFQQSLKEMLCSRAITTGLEKHIDYLAILVDCPPQVLLLAIYFFKHFVDVKSIAEPLMAFLHSFRILRAELIASETNRFIAYGNTAFSQ